MIAGLLDSLKLNNKVNGKKLFVFYLFVLTLILLVEGIMSYYFPIVLDLAFDSTLVVGAIISFANIIAASLDFLIPEVFKKRTWRFLLLMAVIFQTLFPTLVQIGIFTNFSILLVLAAVFWNIYYEFMAFSRQNFLVLNEKKEDYSRDWGLFALVNGFTSIIGPIIGSRLLNISFIEGSVTIGALQLFAVISVLLLISTSPVKQSSEKLEINKKIKLNLLKEFKVWEVLGKRVLPAIIMGTTLAMQFSAIATVGGILGEQLLGEQKLDWLLMFMFYVPSVLVSLFLSRIRVPRFKKLASQIALIGAGGILITLPFVYESTFLVITVFFISSIFSSTAWIFNEAVYSDLSRRSGDQKLYINSIERLNDSVGFFIGPLLIGFLSDQLGFFVGFQIIGALCLLVGVILLMVTPKKLLIPHQELAEIKQD